MTRILIVEDNADIAEGLQANLEIEGYEVEIARDGRHAFMAVKSAMPDLIVLDLGLPVVDGFTVLETLRSQGCTSPVLILSARGAETDKLHGFRLGADDYVTKPFGTMELMARVGALLRRFAAKAPAAAATSATSSPAAAKNASAEAELTLDDETLAARYGLTPRQAAVARLLTQGLSNEEVADQLGISRFTARNHTEQVLAKIGAPTRARVGAILRGNVLLS
ncbi:MAG: response regulator [Phycisphaerae bacterium]|nr:response regulator [Gemmatimonadaceae bacterium]